MNRFSKFTFEELIEIEFGLASFKKLSNYSTPEYDQLLREVTHLLDKRERGFKV